MTVIGYIPLDERPVNTRYPAMIARIAGAEVRLPPAHLLSNQRNPADRAGLSEWMLDVAPQLDGLIVSLEQLAHAGLINSRISHEPPTAILGRLELLRRLRAAHPRLPLYAFSVITRVSNANDAVEEPAYWAEYGERLYAFSQTLDRRRHGQAVESELAHLKAMLPTEMRRDMLLRRLRNHVINGAALHMLGEGVFDLLVISADDTSPFGLPARERQFLSEWADLLDNSLPLLMYPGADEVACALLMRMLHARTAVQPQIAVHYAPPASAAHVAAYEDGPVRETVARQISACGAALVTDPDAPIWLAVNGPHSHREEWSAERAAADRAARQTDIGGLSQLAHKQMQAGKAVAIADVAYPNGADPLLIDEMRRELELTKLAAYGAWNTAGNTIGTVLAQACAAQLSTSADSRAAQQRFLLHRFVEDWAYQHRIRAELRTWLRNTHGVAEPSTPALLQATLERIELRLNQAIAELPGFAEQYRIRPGSVRLPWGRMFEVDFEIVEV